MWLYKHKCSDAERSGRPIDDTSREMIFDDRREKVREIAETVYLSGEGYITKYTII